MNLSAYFQKIFGTEKELTGLLAHILVQKEALKQWATQCLIVLNNRCQSFFGAYSSMERNECAQHMCHAHSLWLLLFSVVSYVLGAKVQGIEIQLSIQAHNGTQNCCAPKNLVQSSAGSHPGVIAPEESVYTIN